MALARLTELELIGLSMHEDGDIDVVGRLIWGNPGVNPNLPNPHPDFGLMNDTQRAVAALAEFQGQVLNGGVSQYLFNCPDQVGMLLDALAPMEWPEFSDEVQRAFADLDETAIANLAGARGVWDDASEFADRWAAFRKWADQVNDDEFNAWFYDHQAEFVRRLMQLVWRRRSELITGGA